MNYSDLNSVAQKRAGVNRTGHFPGMRL